jgi:hypothetical protein
MEQNQENCVAYVLYKAVSVREERLCQSHREIP